MFLFIIDSNNKKKLSGWTARFVCYLRIQLSFLMRTAARFKGGLTRPIRMTIINTAIIIEILIRNTFYPFLNFPLVYMGRGVLSTLATDITDRSSG